MVSALPSWELRGLWASLYALHVLDPEPDPTLDEIVAFASELCQGPVLLLLRDGDSWVQAAEAEPQDWPAPDPATQSEDTEIEDLVSAPVHIANLAVGLLQSTIASKVGSDTVTANLTAAAKAVGRHLERRWEMARNDDAGPVGVIVVDDEFQIRWVSPEMDELAEGESSGWIGESVFMLLDDTNLPDAAADLHNIDAGRGRTATVPIHLRLSSRGVEGLEVQAVNRKDDPDVGALCFVIRRAAEPATDFAILGDQTWILNTLASGRPLEDVLVQIVQLLERHGEDAHCVVMLLDEDRELLEPAVAPSMSESVIDGLAHIKVGPSEPAGGASTYLRMPQYTAQLRSARGWEGRRSAAVREGFQACWSAPVASMTDSEVLGSVDWYRKSPGEPNDAQTRLLLVASRLVSVALTHELHQRQLRHAATHDPLTDLPNRSLFATALGEAAGDGNLAVLFIDLDRFKLINDTLGHDFGDELLQQVARRLDRSLNHPALVARFGGDEFTVLLPKVEAELHAATEARRLLAVIDEPFMLRGQTVSVRASAGVAMTEEVLDDPHALVRMADAALYHAKDRGRGRVELYSQKLIDWSTRRLQVERQLSDAIETGDLFAEFQPEVRISDGVVIAIEALARCRTPTGELIPPSEFIPAAEEAGLIDDVFTTVLAEALRTATAVKSSSPEPIVAWVNLSPLQLGSRRLLDLVESSVAFSGASRPSIGFEVTEHAILADPDEACELLDALVQLGYRVALDDFGTGFSSLAHLRNLPVDTVKLDRQFVVAAGRDPKSRAIAEGVIGLSHAMGLTCVAEGVETEHELAVITGLGCDVVQGYFFSRPCDSADLYRCLEPGWAERRQTAGHDPRS